MRTKDKYGKHSSLYLISDDFFAVMKRHHTILIFLAHYMTIVGSGRMILDEGMYDYLIKRVGVTRVVIQKFLRELVSVGALKKVGFVYYMHPEIFYRGKWVLRTRYFHELKFDAIDKVIANYMKLEEKLKQESIKSNKKPSMNVIKSIK